MQVCKGQGLSHNTLCITYDWYGLCLLLLKLSRKYGQYIVQFLMMRVCDGCRCLSKPRCQLTALPRPALTDSASTALVRLVLRGSGARRLSFQVCSLTWPQGPPGHDAIEMLVCPGWAAVLWAQTAERQTSRRQLLQMQPPEASPTAHPNSIGQDFPARQMPGRRTCGL